MSFPVPGSLGLVEDDNVIQRRRARITKAVVAEMVNVLDERLSPLGDVALADPPPRSFRRANSSRVRASRNTATSGPLPDRKTAWEPDSHPAASLPR